RQPFKSKSLLSILSRSVFYIFISFWCKNIIHGLDTWVNVTSAHSVLLALKIVSPRGRRQMATTYRVILTHLGTRQSIVGYLRWRRPFTSHYPPSLPRFPSLGSNSLIGGC